MKYWKLITFTLILLAIATRFAGIEWGLPYPMHPDERNMVIAVNQLSCPSFPSPDCLNPHFYAYGQFPLYLSYFMSQLQHALHIPISTASVTLTLRFISAIASLLTIYIQYQIVHRLFKLSYLQRVLALLSFIFVPVMIQLGHFGTTESLLMFFTSILTLWGIELVQGSLRLKSFMKKTAIVMGLALGTKVSALSLGVIPVLAIMISYKHDKRERRALTYALSMVYFMMLTALVFLISSPHNLINYQDFINSIRYESSVGLGSYKAFYTRSFEYTLPVVFQFFRVFPYALGWPLFSLSLLGFVFLPWNRTNLLLRGSVIILFLSQAFIYAKWTRFLAPVYPILIVLGVCLFLQLITRLRYQVIALVACIFMIIPGVAYLSIYTTPDVRFQASEWVYKNMPVDSKILAETANVVDVPIPAPYMEKGLYDGKQYDYISFNFYDMHMVPELQDELDYHVSTADYVMIPSRRVFANSTCYRFGTGKDAGRVWEDELKQGYIMDRCARLQADYPQVNEYYDELFAADSDFKLVAEFTSYPRLTIFGKTIWEMPDEQAEETWTVFDHPVVRVYQRTE
ncbi:MAG: ArnT family glycosyltransferase [Weeksellaceae bacterium]